MVKSDLIFQLSYYKYGLISGVLNLSDLICFVDKTIEKSEAPHEVLIQLSLSKKLNEALLILNEFLIEKVKLDEIGHKLLKKLIAQLKNEFISPEDFISKAQTVVWETNLNNDIKSKIGDIDDNYFQASEGYGNYSKTDLITDLENII